jgi:hypothetical protein
MSRPGRGPVELDVPPVSCSGRPRSDRGSQGCRVWRTGPLLAAAASSQTVLADQATRARPQGSSGRRIRCCLSSGGPLSQERDSVRAERICPDYRCRDCPQPPHKQPSGRDAIGGALLSSPCLSTLPVRQSRSSGTTRFRRDVQMGLSWEQRAVPAAQTRRGRASPHPLQRGLPS